jgi:hypothetical protein
MTIKLKPVETTTVAAYIAALPDGYPRTSYEEDQAYVIGEALADSDDLLCAWADVFNRADDPNNAVLSIAVFAFQLGRQFEVREMARAMRQS